MGQVTGGGGIPASGPSDSDRRLLRDSLRGYLERHWPAARSASRAGDGQALAALWQGFAAQGLTGLGADPEQGGLRELVLVFEELGRACCPAPLLGAMMANLALTPSRGNAAARGLAAALLEQLAQGSARVATAFGAHDGDPAAGRVSVSGTGAVRTLDGRIAFVEGAGLATHVLVFTEAPSGMVIVATDAAGYATRETPGLAVPAFSELAFRATSGAFIEVSPTTLADLVLQARLACAARALGAAQRSFELAVEHAKVRRQFDRVIGQFQALQHKLVNCLMSLEGSRLTLEAAAQARDAGEPGWRTLGQAALAFCGPAVREVSVQAICALGAIGYAEEHEAPWHFRRAHADLARFGGAPRARAELAESILGPLA